MDTDQGGRTTSKLEGFLYSLGHMLAEVFAVALQHLTGRAIEKEVYTLPI